MAYNTERTINGTHGEAWLDGEKVYEVFGLNAKIEFEKEDVSVCGSMASDTKLIGYKGKGSIKLRKVNSRMHLKLSADIQRGILPRFQILSALKDPAAWGAERILIKDACFDDLTLIDFEAKKSGEVECPFTFTKWEPIDLIKPKQ